MTALWVGSDSSNSRHSVSRVVQPATNLLNCTVIHVILVYRMSSSLLKSRYTFVCDIPLISMTYKTVKKGNVTGLVKDGFVEPILALSNHCSLVFRVCFRMFLEG